MASNDQKGTTTLDLVQLAAQTNQLQKGAEVVAHEEQHAIDASKEGVAKTKEAVEKTERNAYKTSEAVESGFGKFWTTEQFEEAVAQSVKNWETRQEEALEAAAAAGAAKKPTEE